MTRDPLRDIAYDAWWAYCHPSEFNTSGRLKRLRYETRSALCRLGVHWITWYEGTPSYYGPAEPGYECAFCGHEGEPRRARFWWPLKWRVQEWWYG